MKDEKWLVAAVWDCKMDPALAPIMAWARPAESAFRDVEEDMCHEARDCFEDWAAVQVKENPDWSYEDRLYVGFVYCGGEDEAQGMAYSTLMIDDVNWLIKKSKGLGLEYRYTSFKATYRHGVLKLDAE